jgi:ubiquinone/menaquinone biosynthesis C-methylase UbiE
LALHKHASRGPETPATAGITIGSARMYEVGRTLLFGLDERLWSMVLELADVRPGQRVLDVGCGTGALALTLSGAVGPNGEVFGIDASPGMIEFSRRKASRAGAKVDFRVALIERLPFPDSSFDRVVNTLVMHHLPDEVKRQGLEEVFRVLEPGGSFLAVDLRLPDSTFAKTIGRMLLGHHMARSDITDSLEPLRLAGFREVETGPTRYSWFSYVRGAKGGAPQA